MKFAAPGEQAQRFVAATRLFQLAVSLGAVESLIEQPATMGRASYDPAARQTHGIVDGLVRLSVGLEDPQDLWNDLQQALATSLGDAPTPIGPGLDREDGETVDS